jgi:hypothetical protein
MFSKGRCIIITYPSIQSFHNENWQARTPLSRCRNATSFFRPQWPRMRLRLAQRFHYLFIYTLITLQTPIVALENIRCYTYCFVRSVDQNGCYSIEISSRIKNDQSFYVPRKRSLLYKLIDLGIRDVCKYVINKTPVFS